MNSTDDEIDKAEKVVGAMSMSDANMRLVVNMTRLTENVSSLSSTLASITGTVTSLGDQVNGGAGIRNEIKDLRRDLGETNKEVKEISDNFKEARSFVLRIAWFFVVVGIMTIIADIRGFLPFLLEGAK